MSGTKETTNLAQSSSSPHTTSVNLHATSPRSALRHRPIQQESEREQEPPRVPRASRTRKLEMEPEKVVGLRPASEQAPITTTSEPITNVPLSPTPTKQARPHWLMLLGTGMAVALLIVMVTQATVGWLSTTLDDLHYGRPRTFQIDAFVGHETNKSASHFIVMNLQGRIHIVEIPGGDPAHTRIFIGPELVGSGADLIPATIHFVDSRNDKHPDMYLQAGSVQVVYHNTGTTFQPT
jgi:hypothetical protein